MLRRKMLRDLFQNKGSYLACIIIIIIGLSNFTSYSLVRDSLTRAQQDFYQQQNFADGFIEVQAMPYDQVEKLRDIEGIQDIQGRIVKDLRVMFPGRDDNVTLRCVSLDFSQMKILNDVKLLQGSALSERENTIWVDNKYFEANKLSLNQEIEVIAGGEKKSLRVVGMGCSPEFIFAIRNAGDQYPDPQTFGIAFIPLKVMKSLLEQGEINNLTFTLKPGAEYKDVENKLKAELNPYGLKSMAARKDQISHFSLTLQLDSMKTNSIIMPSILLAIAAMILFITLKRMIERQRGQIGILKAIGYRRKEILLHYMAHAFLIGLMGGLIGCICGLMMSYGTIAMYKSFYNLPGFEGRISFAYFLPGIGFSLIFALFAGYRGSLRALLLEPSEAMRPAAPESGKESIFERNRFFWNMFTVPGRMAVRNISRRPGRTAFLFLAIVLTFALLAFSWSFKKLGDETITDQYQKLQTYNLKVVLAAPQNEKAVFQEASRYPGVNYAETMAEIPVTLKKDWLKKDVTILGLAAGSKLYHVRDNDGREVQFPRDGILLSERLAQLLDAKVGTVISVAGLMMADPETDKELQVSGIVTQNFGLNGFMEIESLQNLIGQNNLCTSLILQVDQDKISQFQEDYRNTAAVNGIEDSTTIMKQTQKAMGVFKIATIFMVIFGMIIGFAITYNASQITISERIKDLAMMMVLGMKPKEAMSVVTFEQWLIGILGILAGIPLAKLLMQVTSQTISSDLFTMSSQMDNIAFVSAFLVTFISIWIAQRLAARKIRKLDLVEVLKDRE
ncbi:MAG TPA: ABC transporter permease [Desulfitobacteriaceae bacterium]|nr:ABC transporter permease [Desulfitobacteriaceae bacterium]